MRSILLTSICLICLSNTLFTQSGNLLFDDTQLHEIKLSFSESAYWDTLSSYYLAFRSFSGADIPYLAAKVNIDGHTLDSIGVRLRGKSSYGYATEFKKPFKLDLNEFVNGQHYNGIKKVNLHNGACDPSMLRDFIAYDVMRTAGVKAPRVAHCKLYINEIYWGVYTMIEQIDKTFVEDNFSSGKGDLYKNNDWSSLEWLGSEVAPYQEIFEKKTNETEEWTNFIEFIDVVNNTPDAEFASAIQKVFNVDNYLKILAVDVALDNWDSYIVNRRNWYLYHNPTTDLFEWIPWDYNLSMGGFFSTAGNPYRSYDLNCPFRSDFYYYVKEDTVQFFDRSAPTAHTWLWKFGDGTTSTLPNPVKQFDTTAAKIEVCLTAQSDLNGQTCTFTKCQKIDFDFEASTCFSIESGMNPHNPLDPKVQIVVREDQYCCEEGWDALCEEKYQNLLTEQDQLPPVEVNFDFKNLPIITTDTTKALIRRILAVPQFRNRYFELMCNLLTTNYTQERLQSLIIKQAAIIRQAIYEDPNYIFTRDHFEYDVGDGTGGGHGTEIPSLNHFFNLKLPIIQAKLAEVSQDCGTNLRMFNWQNITINEFVAANEEEDDNNDIEGITDADGEYDDWIELYNNTDEDISLSGFYLTDDFTKVKKWAFPKDAILPANDFVIVWADKDEGQTGFHTNFKLSSDGEALMLSYEDGTILDSLSFGEQKENIAMARIPNGTGDFVQLPPSFNRKNEIISSTNEIRTSPKFEIYPNPNNGQFNIDFKQFVNKNVDLSIYNILGKKVWQRKVKNERNINIAIPNLVKGTYLCQIENEEIIAFKKIIIN